MAEGLRRIALGAQIGLRGDIDDARFRDGVAGALGLDVPRTANTVAGSGATFALWLGPDEWLVTADDSGLAGSLRGALDGVHAAVVDLGASRVVFELSGPRAGAVLAQGCGLDLHPRAFAPSRCAQTALARAAVLLHLVDDAPTWRIFVRRSYAGYLAAWLERALTHP